MCYHDKFRRFRSKIRGTLRHIPETGSWLQEHSRAPHITKPNSCRSICFGVWAYVERSRNTLRTLWSTSAPLGRRRGSPLEICFSHTCVTLPNSVFLWRSAIQFLTPHAPPFEVSQGHWNLHGSIGYLSLPISVLSGWLHRIIVKLFWTFWHEYHSVFF